MFSNRVWLGRSIFVLLAVPGIAHAGDDKSWTIQEVISNCEAREKALSTFIYDADYTVTSESLRSGENITYTVSEHIEYDRSGGRFYYHRVGGQLSGPTPEIGKMSDWVNTTDQVSTFDGALTRAIRTVPGFERGTGKPAGDQRTAWVDKGLSASWTVSPCSLFGSALDFAYPLSRILREANYTCERADDGALKLECDHGNPSSEGDRNPRMSRYWVQPGKGCLLVRTELLLKHPGFTEWVPYYEETFDNWKDENGCWYPASARMVQRRIKPNGAKTLLHDITMKVRNMSINIPIPDSRFKLTFKPGDVVRDGNLGTVYKVDEINDEKVAEVADEAKRLKQRYDSSSELLEKSRVEAQAFSRKVMIAGACTAVAVVVAAMVLAIRVRRTAGSRDFEQGRGGKT